MLRFNNRSKSRAQCKDEEYECMVKRFSYTTSTENATSGPKMWSLERRCTNSCMSGCIVIGERTKLYACTSCCNTSYCNSGRGSGSHRMSPHNPAAAMVALLATVLGSSAMSMSLYTLADYLWQSSGPLTDRRRGSG